MFGRHRQGPPAGITLGRAEILQEKIGKREKPNTETPRHGEEETHAETRRPQEMTKRFFYHRGHREHRGRDIIRRFTQLINQLRVLRAFVVKNLTRVRAGWVVSHTDYSRDGVRGVAGPPEGGRGGFTTKSRRTRRGRGMIHRLFFE
jgi:hypothetical protein